MELLGGSSNCTLQELKLFMYFCKSPLVEGSNCTLQELKRAICSVRNDRADGSNCTLQELKLLTDKQIFE